jgi:ferric-dicitrate binding protein FerR (iron transport regulator)
MHHLRLSLPAAALFFALSPLAWAKFGKVVEVEGLATWSQGSRKLTLTNGLPIPGPGRVRTGKGARLKLILDGDIALLLKENSECEISPNKARQAAIDLKKGSVLAEVRNPGKIPKRFTIRTRAAVMGVRGTTFYVRDEAGKPFFLCTCEGTVGVSAKGKPETLLTATKHDVPKFIEPGLQLKPASFASASELGHSDDEITELRGDLKNVAAAN